MSSTKRNYSGQIVYRGENGIRGRENFSMNIRDTGRTIRAYCEIDEDEPVVRDTSWTLDSDWRPIEAHVRVTLGERLGGSLWFHLADTHVECESLSGSYGRVSQRLEGRADYMGLHPLVGDGLIGALRGCHSPGVEIPLNSITYSYAANGDTDLLALPLAIGVIYVGEESVEVPAGRFDAHHFQIKWQPHWPAANLWVHGEDFIFLRLSWEVSRTTSELVSLSQTGPVSNAA